MIAEQIWAELEEGNRRFVSGQSRVRDLVREREALKQAQSPRAIVLACSDSRVAPEIIFDQPLGELFVVRVAGNVADKFAIGSIEFAAEHFDSALLIVLGHQKCGGVKVACAGGKLESAHLKALVAAIRTSLTADYSSTTDLAAAERENARGVARSLLDRSELLHRRMRDGRLAVVSAYYRLDSGAVERL